METRKSEPNHIGAEKMERRAEKEKKESNRCTQFKRERERDKPTRG